jgi:hypothetical protein
MKFFALAVYTVYGITGCGINQEKAVHDAYTSRIFNFGRNFRLFICFKPLKTNNKPENRRLSC